jgi:hypothetical protein
MGDKIGMCPLFHAAGHPPDEIMRITYSTLIPLDELTVLAPLIVLTKTRLQGVNFYSMFRGGQEGLRVQKIK